MGFNSGFKGLINIRPVGADLFNANGKTDRRAGGGTQMTADSCFPIFCERAYKLASSSRIAVDSIAAYCAYFF